jgi:hypothetical protein
MGLSEVREGIEDREKGRRGRQVFDKVMTKLWQSGRGNHCPRHGLF